MKLYLVGGFLGSGKTTAIKNAASHCVSEGASVGIITNDQGTQLVDTEYLSSSKVSAREVTGGCFCCKYSELESHISQLKIVGNTDIIFAESVGSCTDLIATVANPVIRFLPDVEVLISIFADAQVLPSMLFGASLFKDNVRYIYNKQIEEADILIVNKIDMISSDDLGRVKQLVKHRYPDKLVLYQSSTELADIKVWVENLNAANVLSRSALDINYNIYGEGEAELAWLDMQFDLYSDSGDAWKRAGELVKEIHEGIVSQSLPIGHLKFLIDDGVRKYKLSYTMIEKAEAIPDFSTSRKLRILLNARVETEPEKLREIIYSNLIKLSVTMNFRFLIDHVSVFKPGFPTPTHRLG